MNTEHFGYLSMIVGAVIAIVSMALSFVWHKRDAGMPDPREGDRPWDVDEWAQYHSAVRAQRLLQCVGVLMLYVGCVLATLGFLIVGIVGYLRT